MTKLKSNKHIRKHKRKHTRKYKAHNKAMTNQQPKYYEHVSEPWFTLISLGLKTIEGRLNKGRFAGMTIGEIIEWHNEDFNPRTIRTRIIRKTIYPTFEEYLIKEKLNKCLPGIPNIEHGLGVYYKYFTKEQEQTFGIIAIEIELI